MLNICKVTIFCVDLMSYNENRLAIAIARLTLKKIQDKKIKLIQDQDFREKAISNAKIQMENFNKLEMSDFLTKEEIKTIYKKL